MKKTIEIAALTLVFFTVPGICQENLSKSEQRKLQARSEQFLLMGDPLNAWQNSKKILRANPAHRDAGTSACVAASQLNYPADSILFTEQNLRQAKDPDAKYFLGIILHRQRKFSEAEGFLNDYKSLPSRKRMFTEKQTGYYLAVCQSATMHVKDKKNQQIKNIGNSINSPFADYVPVLSLDESELYFTSKRPTATNEKNADNNYFEDVFVSKRTNGSWSAAAKVDPPINSITNDACVALSPEGRRLIIYRTAADITTGDLFISRLGDDNKWTEPLKMNDLINSPHIETSACFSNDTSEIFFSSDRPGGFGGKDLYRIKVLPNGNWSTPFNLGPNINSEYDEDAPYIHPDGKTLYFSSRGHNTMGEYDVFKSVYSREENQFSPAENLGYPINDVGNDIFFVLSANGKKGYYSSARDDTHGSMDIYEIDTRYNDQSLIAKSCYVLKDGVGSKAQITIKNQATDETVGNYNSHPADGRFIVILDPLKKYMVTIESEDSKTETVELDLDKNADQEKIVFNIHKKGVQ